MPNGHGGVPFLAGPILLGLAFLFVFALPLPAGVFWLHWVRLAACVLLAAGLGWRVAYYRYLHAVDDYGGAYTPKEVYVQSARRYWAAVPVYSMLFAAVAFAIFWWRGLP